MGSERSRPIVVGVTESTADRVIEEAVALAVAFGAHLACVYVDESRIPIGEAPDGTVITAPVAAGGPCSAETFDGIAGGGATARLSERASAAGVVMDFHVLAGATVTALARFAVDQHARMIVVGTHRHGGLRASLQLLMAGPVASQLARRQPVPVVIVPVHDRAPVTSAEFDRLETDALEDPIPDPADVLYGEGHA